MAKDFVIGGFPNQSMDVDADGDYIYLAVLLNSAGFPQALRLDTDLDEDATVEFDPGAGTYIGLICGNEDGGIVWAAGDFGGTDKVVKLDDELGDYWVVADPGIWYGEARPLFVGPSDDNWVHVGLPDDDSIQNTYFLANTGPYWVEVNSATPFDIRSWDILDRDLDQMIIGVDPTDPYWASYFYPYVEYSPNAGESFGDITGILNGISNSAITSVIYG